MDWVDLYPKSRKPRFEDIQAYLSPQAGELFRTLVDGLASQFGLRYMRPRYSAKTGWGLGIGKSGLVMVNGITFNNGGFVVEGTPIPDRAALDRVLVDLAVRYRESFAAQFAEFSARRSGRQKERTALARLAGQIDTAELNVYAWAPRVPRRTLERLYQSDARGVPDTELVDAVGYALYARCVQARDERALIETGRLKCHQCGAILPWSDGIMTCACGRRYMFRDYMRSFRAANMPRGAAAAVFDRFIAAWPRATNYAAKMLLVDRLVHEFHVGLVSGLRGPARGDQPDSRKPGSGPGLHRDPGPRNGGVKAGTPASNLAVVDEYAPLAYAMSNKTTNQRGLLMRNEFTAVIERDDEWFVAYSPEIPGANGQGKSKQEALSSLKDAIALILEDRREDGLRGVPASATREVVVVE